MKNIRNKRKLSTETLLLKYFFNDQFQPSLLVKKFTTQSLK